MVMYNVAFSCTWDCSIPEKKTFSAKRQLQEFLKVLKYYINSWQCGDKVDECNLRHTDHEVSSISSFSAK
jgi:hypothetical protein